MGLKPAYFRVSPVNINGIMTNRLMIVLRTKGCEYARKTGGCTVCGFINNAIENISDNDMIEQLDYCLGNLELNGIEEIDLLTLGSFLNNNEVSPSARRRLLSRIAELNNIKRISVESRAEYISLDKLHEIKDIVSNKILEIGIGLESADDIVRNKIIKKGLSKKAFENVVSIIRQLDYNLLVYLLIKPPGLSEIKAIEDAVDSVRYVFEIANKYNVPVRTAFEPVFICKNTVLEKLYLNAEYRLVNLWSVVEVIKRTHHFGTIFIGLSDENLSYDRMPFSCLKCNKKIIEGIELFNKTQDVSTISELDCECKINYQNMLEQEGTAVEQIKISAYKI